MDEAPVLIIAVTNAIESMHMQLRKIEKDWKLPPVTWRLAVNQFTILLGERFTSAMS